LNSRMHILTATLLFAVITVGYWLLATYWPAAYIWSTYEDLHGEWAQTFFFVAVFLLSARLATSQGTYRVFFGLLAIACLYVVMEEISWGQRIFSIESPDLFKRHNLQGETNLHNFLVGPYSTLTKDIVEYTLAVALVLYGLVYPVMLRLNLGIAKFVERIGIPAPPLYLWPSFVTAAYLETAPFHFNEAEIAELLVGSALMVMVAQYGYARRNNLVMSSSAVWTGSQSARFSLEIIMLVFVVAAAAGLTARAVYNQPANHAKINSRILNGYEKFAGRYENINRPDVAADLYLRIHEKEPDRTSILRRLAKSLQKTGDQEGFELYTRKALEIGIRKYAIDPNRVSTNLSLARSYKQLGDARRSIQHAELAHKIALRRVVLEPDDAKRVYWLAKTYRQLGKYVQALSMYQKAYRLNPRSRKYRKAYYSMRRRVGG